MKNNEKSIYQKPQATIIFFSASDTVDMSGYGLLAEGYGDEIEW